MTLHGGGGAVGVVRRERGDDLGVLGGVRVLALGERIRLEGDLALKKSGARGTESDVLRFMRHEALRTRVEAMDLLRRSLQIEPRKDKVIELVRQFNT